MAEVFGIIAAAIGVADVGARISAKLYTFGVLVASADETISSISKEVALTSTVLKELGNFLAKDRPESPIVTEIAIRNIKETVQECDKAFEQIDTLLLKRVPKLRLGKGSQGHKAAIVLERFGWQAVEPKVQLLRSNIDRLKSSLLLMLNVLMLAWFISERNGPQSVIDSKKTLCEHLLHSKETYASKFDELENFRNHSAEASKTMPVKFTSKVSPKSSGNRGPHSPATPDPDREPRYTQPMSEPHQNVGVGTLSDQATLASYKINVLRKLQQDYNELFASLVEEVRAQKYDIDRESRSRIECQIGIARSNELSQLDLMASTTSILRYSSSIRYEKAQESRHSVSHTIVRDHDIRQATCVVPAQMTKSDTDDAGQKSDAFKLTQRSKIQEAQGVRRQDDFVATTSSTWYLCPHKHCKRSQGIGFPQSKYLAQHMRQVHNEVPVSDERDNQRRENLLLQLPPSAEDAKSDNTPSVLGLARPVVSKAQEHQSTLWTKISDPPVDSASRRARLGRYTTNHTLPTFGTAGGRGAYDIISSVPRPRPPPIDISKEQKHKSQASIHNGASLNRNSRQGINDKKHFPSASASPPKSLRAIPQGAHMAQKPNVSSLLAGGTSRAQRMGGGRNLDKEGPPGRKPTVSDLLALWTTIRDV